VDIPGKLHNIMQRIDRFDNSFVWFREALFRASESGNAVEAILTELGRVAEEFIENDLSQNLCCVFDLENYLFRCESLFLDSCVQSCTDILRGGCDLYRWNHRMFSGIANMADSLVAVKRLIDDEKRLTLPELRQILDADFAGHEELLAELKTRMPKYGNGIQEVDELAARAANTLIDAAEKAARKTGFIMMTSLYSLTHHARFGSVIGATPDGRRAGETISENQSPVHGMDVNGPTELLKSVAALPLDRCICGGLNVKFGNRMTSETLMSLMKSFFALDGQHIGFTMADRATLEDARKHPENHRSLLVRKTGFSEFYISLSPLEQQEIIDRTEY
jgi:formate C-acetyltransferase